MEKIIIKKESVKNINLDFFDELLDTFTYLKNDTEQYRLLVYLTNYFNNVKILDVGTCQGHSCLSLSQNNTNKIVSYDIEKNRQQYDLSKLENVTFNILDINKETDNNINSAEFILLDIDPHDGKQERIFFDTLKKIGYKGFVILDDIHISPQMELFWYNIKEEKFDLTDIGHVSGTGLVNFSNKTFDIC